MCAGFLAQRASYEILSKPTPKREGGTQTVLRSEVPARTLTALRALFFSVALLAFSSSTSRAHAEPPDSPVVDRPVEHEIQWAPPVLHTTSLFVVMRATETVLWPDPLANFDADFVGARYEDAYTLPPKFDATRSAFEWDGDHWTINVLGHGAARQRALLARSDLPLRLGRLARLRRGGFGGGSTASRPTARGRRHKIWSTRRSRACALGEARFRAARALEGRGGFAGVLRVVLDPFGKRSARSAPLLTLGGLSETRCRRARSRTFAGPETRC